MSWEGENANSLLFGVVSGRLESKVYFLRRTQPYNDGQFRLLFKDAFVVFLTMPCSLNEMRATFITSIHNKNFTDHYST